MASAEAVVEEMFCFSTAVSRLCSLTLLGLHVTAIPSFLPITMTLSTETRFVSRARRPRSTRVIILVPVVRTTAVESVISASASPKDMCIDSKAAMTSLVWAKWKSRNLRSNWARSPIRMAKEVPGSWRPHATSDIDLIPDTSRVGLSSLSWANEKSWPKTSGIWAESSFGRRRVVRLCASSFVSELIGIRNFENGMLASSQIFSQASCLPLKPSRYGLVLYASTSFRGRKLAPNILKPLCSWMRPSFCADETISFAAPLSSISGKFLTSAPAAASCSSLGVAVMLSFAIT